VSLKIDKPPDSTRNVYFEAPCVILAAAYTETGMRVGRGVRQRPAVPATVLFIIAPPRLCDCHRQQHCDNRPSVSRRRLTDSIQTACGPIASCPWPGRYLQRLSVSICYRSAIPNS